MGIVFTQKPNIVTVAVSDGTGEHFRYSPGSLADVMASLGFSEEKPKVRRKRRTKAQLTEANKVEAPLTSVEAKPETEKPTAEPKKKKGEKSDKEKSVWTAD